LWIENLFHDNWFGDDMLCQVLNFSVRIVSDLVQIGHLQDQIKDDS